MWNTDKYSSYSTLAFRVVTAISVARRTERNGAADHEFDPGKDKLLGFTKADTVLRKELIEVRPF